MTERDPGRDARKPAGNASKGVADRQRRFEALQGALLRGGRVGAAVLALGLLAAVLLVATELSTLREVDVLEASCEDTALRPEQKDACTETGGEQHGYALLAVAALVLAMAYGAGPGRSRPAAAALIAAGVVVLAIAVLGDLPEIGDEGAVGPLYASAEAKAGPALAYEIVGGALALVAGALRLARPARAE